MAALRFSATILQRGVNPYVPVSAAQAARLQPGLRRPMPVLVTVNGKPDPPWRINMMPAGDGGFLLYLHGAVRKASGTAVGDRVRLTMAFDAAYRGGPAELPSWFEAALAKDRTARANWGKLTPSRQKEVVRYLAALKSEAARQRNLERALAVLRGKANRFMARSWKDGA
jgi:hypothetical protein